MVGRVICERKAVVATIRDHGLRALSRVPRSRTAYQKLMWIPAARYSNGFFAADGHKALGWQIPQPWVADASGARVRLDDALGGNWAVVHTDAAPSGTDAWTRFGATTLRVTEPSLVSWLRNKKAAAAVVRPDGFIYAAAQSEHPVPPPPAGIAGNTVTTEIKTGASA
jgi:3-(3-hydroxy-phenyl)propionate hydroxylase